MEPPGSSQRFAPVIPLPCDYSVTPQFGVWVGRGGVAMAAGPLVGGVLDHVFDWRSIFFVNLPIGLAGIWMTWRITRDDKSSQDHRFDPVGAIDGDHRAWWDDRRSYRRPDAWLELPAHYGIFISDTYQPPYRFCNKSIVKYPTYAYAMHMLDANKLGALAAEIHGRTELALETLSPSAAAVLSMLHFKSALTTTQLADVVGVSQPTPSA